MSETGYRAPDFSLAHRIENHEFGKASASALFAPTRFALTMIEATLQYWGVTPPQERASGVVIPFSKFRSFYGQHSQRAHE